jgi:hypothetical protein
MKLLVRRAVLVSRIRNGRDHASSPEAVQSEKAVRMAWETGALAFSKDPRFTRQLFTLLQDLKVLSKEQAEQSSTFILAPSRKAVAGEVEGPVDIRTAQMHIAVAACRGDSLFFDALPSAEALLDTINACVQAGAAISRHAEGRSPGSVAVRRGAPLSFTGKAIYVGENFFTLYLMAFLAAGRSGVCRLTGGARLKGADISFLRQLLPVFGARLAPVVPRSQGLPVSLESSGDIPSHAPLPADLPLEAVCALLSAPLVWNVPITFDLAALPASVAAAALARIAPVYLACGVDMENRGSHLIYTPGTLHPSEMPRLPLEPSLSAYLLSLPAFAGGSLTLRGVWPLHLPESREAELLLSWAGMGIRALDESVTVEATRPPFVQPLPHSDLSPEFFPLFLALAAKNRLIGASGPPLQQAAPFSAEHRDDALAREFCARLGLHYEKGCLSPLPEDACDAFSGIKEGGVTAYPAWASPDALWSMAYSLAAFLRPGLRLANPGNVTSVMPSFWNIYNTLPNPSDLPRRKRESAQEQTDEKAPRRRVIAD